jgi:hypothetical protein
MVADTDVKATPRFELMACPAERILRLSPTYALEHCVPVTARLSKRFYDVLGEDVANELVDWFNAVDLTYRTDLRELNELNYARFDAKLEQRLAELRAELRAEIAGLRAEIRTELQEVRTEVHQGNMALERVRAELLRWMFGFWVTTFIGVAGLLIALGNR